jgi:hypothetical protein
MPLTAAPVPSALRSSPILARRAIHPAFYAELVLIGLVTYLLHEGAHWLAGTAMGLPMVAHLNGVVLQVPASAGQHAIIDIAGPLVTIVQALFAYAMVKRSASLRAFGYLYMAGFMRIVAGFISFIYLNDEARFSRFLQLPAFVVPLVVGLFLFALIVLASRRLQLGWKTQVACYLVASLTLSLIVGGDMLMRR